MIVPSYLGHLQYLIIDIVDRISQVQRRSNFFVADTISTKYTAHSSSSETDKQKKSAKKVKIRTRLTCDLACSLNLINSGHRVIGVWKVFFYFSHSSTRHICSRAYMNMQLQNCTPHTHTLLH